MAPSTFASAAAAGSNNSTTSRPENQGEWSRRANGATQTFRRPSLATSMSNSPHQRDGSASQPRTSTDSTGVYVPPHISANRNGASNDHRYSKEQMLQLFKVDDIDTDILSELYVGGFEPTITNGSSSATWGRREEHKDSHGADVCWDREAHIVPMGLHDLTEEERELFTTSVNSPLKPPTQATNKDGTPKDTAPHRKSISQSQNSPAYGLSSPTSTRPGNRRRDTSEAYPFPTSIASPAGTSRFSRDEPNTTTPPPALLRRRTDLKDIASGPGSEERDKDKAWAADPAPFGGLKRSTTATAGGSGSSPWPTANQSGGFSPMGAFGSFAIGSNPAPASTPTEKRPGFGSMRGESRFKGLMSKDSPEDSGKNVKEKGSLGSLGRLSEADQDQGVHSWMEARSNRPTSEDTDPFPEQEFRSGSAALGGGFDSSPAQQRGYSNLQDESAFSAFGMTTDTVGHRGTNIDDFQHHTPQHRNEGMHEPMSPTDTNPFQSPENDRTESDDLSADESDAPSGSGLRSGGNHLPGLGGFGNQGGLPGLGGFGAMGRAPAPYEAAASDRSQTSSTGPGRGFGNLGGLGGLPGLGGASTWSAAPSSGTPTRERMAFGGAFGDSIFSSVGDLQSPVIGLSGLGGGSSAFSAAPGSGTIGRGGRMGSLFPAAMQEQIRSEEPLRLGNEGPFDPFERQSSGFSGIGSSAIGSGTAPSRDTDSPFRRNQSLFDDLIGGTSREQEPISAYGEGVTSPFGLSNPLGSGLQNLSSFASQEALGQRSSQPQLQRQPSGVTSPGGTQPPVSQIRTMVMPDRMKWIYKDPQGQTQGPWSGLEMHDWYKGGFFTPELLIKRVEDPDFEPLAQLIRRIGNSREPFLVPQIGVPHEPSANPTRALQPPVAGASSAQPPFASSFPSFGTTLTAEQQNALERRKQEEQYLMARQKEHLAQQQLLIKQLQISGGGHGIQPLHHHSSAHSLHSQPSFGSITSPGGYQPSPTQGPIAGNQAVPGLFDSQFRAGPGAGLGSMSSMEMLSNIREDEVPAMLDRLNLGRGAQPPIGGHAPLGQKQSFDSHPQQVAAMLNDRARLQREQAEHDLQQRVNQGDFDAQTAAERLHQFHDLRIQTEMEQDQQNMSSSRAEYEAAAQSAEREMREHLQREELDRVREEAPSLTQQVQAAASAKQASAQQTSWTKLDMSTMEPMQRPPQSISPMPAPVAQRKQNAAENLVAESRSQTQSPSVETPSATLAPWAKETVEVPKAQSLREIQEAEAKKAAKQEEINIAQRRAALERELAMAQAAAQTAPAPGLPSSANWASTQSPASSSANSPSVWAKPSGKSAGKTLQQIQREEEDRKKRAAAVLASTVSGLGGSAVPSSTGKRYADITSKTASPSSPAAMGNSAWTTVGASGKVKALPTPAGPTPQGRSVSDTVPPVQTPKSAARSTTMGATQMAKMAKADALEEFKKWAVADLQRGQLNNNVDASDLVEMLLALGSDVEILTEAVHSSSQTMDSRHFAEEFVRRRKQADKGLFEPSSTASPSSSKAGNDWSAVAKKGPAQVSPAAQEPFKIAKRKGGRK